MKVDNGGKKITHVYGAPNADTDATTDAEPCKYLTHLQSKGILHSDSLKLPSLGGHCALTFWDNSSFHSSTSFNLWTLQVFQRFRRSLGGKMQANIKLLAIFSGLLQVGFHMRP